jgi:hypothetical protein
MNPSKERGGPLIYQGGDPRVLMHDDTHLIKEGQNPNLNKTSNKKECLTLSKSLAISI